MLTINHNGRTYANWTPSGLRAAGIPEAVIAEAQTAARTAAISAECRRRIYAAASKEAQGNIATSSALIAAKDAAERSQTELDVLAAAGDFSAWVTSMRGAVTALAGDATADFASDAVWPQPPASLPGLVAAF